MFPPPRKKGRGKVPAAPEMIYITGIVLPKAKE